MSIVLAIYLLFTGFVFFPCFITFKVFKIIKERGKTH